MAAMPTNHSRNDGDRTTSANSSGRFATSQTSLGAVQSRSANSFPNRKLHRIHQPRCRPVEPPGLPQRAFDCRSDGHAHQVVEVNLDPVPGSYHRPVVEVQLRPANSSLDCCTR